MILLKYFIILSLLLLPSFALEAQIPANFTEKVDRVISKIDRGEYKNIDGVLVWKDGEIIGEKYWRAWNGDKAHMLQSVTKSITSLLVGIAIHEGLIEEVQQEVLDFFPEYENIQNMDNRKRAITLEDLLTMRTGMEWVEHPYRGSPLAEMNSRQDDWVKFVLNIPMREVPGQTYTYNSGGVILLGGAIKNATGMSVQKFANRHLFELLEITTAEWWFSDNQNLPHTGGGLNMSVKDMLKIGRLILQCGEWKGRQILDCEYINNLFQSYQSESISEVAGYTRGYSLLWHVFPVDPDMNAGNASENFIAAWGAGGQWIMVFPHYDMVVIFIGETQSSEEERLPVRIVYEELLEYSKNQN